MESADMLDIQDIDKMALGERVQLAEKFSQSFNGGEDATKGDFYAIVTDPKVWDDLEGAFCPDGEEADSYLKDHYGDDEAEQEKGREILKDLLEQDIDSVTANLVEKVLKKLPEHVGVSGFSWDSDWVCETFKHNFRSAVAREVQSDFDTHAPFIRPQAGVNAHDFAVFYGGLIEAMRKSITSVITVGSNHKVKWRTAIPSAGA